MNIKLVMTWDIAPEKEQEYFEFMVREFIPRLQKLGFEIGDAWATVYGNQPQIMVGAQAHDLTQVNRILNSPDWNNLKIELLDFVKNYAQKIIRAKNGFQF